MSQKSGQYPQLLEGLAGMAADPLLDRRDLKIQFPHLPNSPNHLRRLEAKGFPPAIKITARRKVWRRSAVVAYLQRKEEEATHRSATLGQVLQ